MPKESIWLAVLSVASPPLMEKTQPSSRAEVSALSAVTLSGSLSLKVPTDGRLWPQMQFCEDKRLWTAALKTPASVPHMLDNVEDAVKVRVCPRIMWLQISAVADQLISVQLLLHQAEEKKGPRDPAPIFDNKGHFCKWLSPGNRQ